MWPVLPTIAFFVTGICADATCLHWGISFKGADVWCHFKHHATSHAEEVATKAVQDTIDSAKNVVNFTITHHPVALTYDWLHADTLNQANAQAEGKLKDIVSVDVGFAKESVDLVLSMFGITPWGYISECLVKNAATGTDQALSANDAQSTPAGKAIISSCISPNAIVDLNPTVFNITGPNQRVGKTLADLASLLMPVGLEEDGSKLALSSFDLSIPGAEDTLRVSKRVEDGGLQHFESENEALAMREKLHDKDWINENCVASQDSTLLDTISTAKRRQRRNRINRRAGGHGLACNIPANFEPMGQPGFDDLLGGGPPDGGGGGDLDPAHVVGSPTGSDAESHVGNQMDFGSFDARFSPYVPENSLVPPPRYQQLVQPPPVYDQAARPGTNMPNYRALVHQLMTDDGAVHLAWREEALQHVHHSGDLFEFLRNVAAKRTPDMQKFYKELGFADSPWEAGDTIEVTVDIPALERFPSDPQLAKLVEFHRNMQTDASNFCLDVLGYPARDFMRLKFSHYYKYISARSPATMLPEGAIGTSNFDAISDTYRDFRTDPGLFSFRAADHPGLVVQQLRGSYRVPIKDNEWILIPGRTFDPNNIPGVGADGIFRWSAATRHAVFDPDIATQGYFEVGIHVRDPLRGGAI